MNAAGYTLTPTMYGMAEDANACDALQKLA